MSRVLLGIGVMPIAHKKDMDKGNGVKGGGRDRMRTTTTTTMMRSGKANMCSPGSKSLSLNIE
jgi:hypothetical protein